MGAKKKKVVGSVDEARIRSDLAERLRKKLRPSSAPGKAPRSHTEDVRSFLPSFSISASVVQTIFMGPLLIFPGADGLAR